MKKKILLSADQGQSAEGRFFQELGFELETEFKTDSHYTFALDEAFPNATKIPRLQTKKELAPTLEPLVRARISDKCFDHPEALELMKKYFTFSQGFDLVETYSQAHKDVYSIKIDDYLNLGFFIDTIVVVAYKAKFDINRLRNYLQSALSFTFKKIEINKKISPVDVAYSHNSEFFVVQISFEVEQFAGKKELISGDRDYLKELIDHANFVDVSFFKKTNKVTISSVFFQGKNTEEVTSYFFTEISGLEARVSGEENSIDLISGLSSSHVPYEIDRSAALENESKRMGVVSKFVLFIKKYRAREESPKELKTLELPDIDHYLSFYPNKEALKAADEDVKALILKFLKDERLFNNIGEFVKRISKTNLDAQVPEILRVLGEKTLEDVEETFMVKGGKSAEESATVVKGWSEVANDEQWVAKKSKINEKINDEVLKIKSEEKNVVQDDLVRIVAGELQGEDEDINVLVSGVVEEVVTNEIVRGQKIEDSLALKILSMPPADPMREKLEGQIVRMKKIMDQMKSEIVRLHQEKVNHHGHDSQGSVDNHEKLQLKETIKNMADLLENKDRLIEKISAERTAILKSKDSKIITLESKIAELRNETLKNPDTLMGEKNHRLEEENKNLLLQLELSNQKINNINENINKREKNISTRYESEMAILKHHLNTVQSTIDNLKQEKLSLEKRLNEEKDSGGSGVKGQGAIEKEAKLQAAIIEKKDIESRYKQQSAELKKLEQKLKYTVSQLEASSKKNSGGGDKKSNEMYTKQIEQATSKLADATLEIAEKRKELVKLKQENSLLLSKLAELEKKLAYTDKKAS